MEKFKRTVEFEKSGEKISIEISMEDCPTQTDRNALLGILNQLFNEVKATICRNWKINKESRTGGIIDGRDKKGTVKRKSNGVCNENNG